MKLQHLLTAAALLFLTQPVHAGFFGHELQADWRFPDFDTVLETHRFVVSNSTELMLGDVEHSSSLQIDVTDDQIIFELIECGPPCNWENTSFNGWWFHDVNGTIPRIIGVDFEVTNGVEGFDESDLFFDNDSVWADFAGVTGPENYDILLTVEFIPAPSAFALFGLASFTTKRRRR